MRKLHYVSAVFAVIAFVATASSGLAWPHKDKEDKEKDSSNQQVVYPIGPDAEGYYTSSTGLKFQDMKKGEGPRPRNGQSVMVHYVGWLTNGQKFDSSIDRGQPFEFVIGAGNVIKGWDEGVKGMHVGGQRRLLIPPQLGYGAKGAGDSIPPNSKLVFDIQLIGVK
jgi:FKBP-type peptidyl-prolyl cis-trans isomerase